MTRTVRAALALVLASACETHPVEVLTSRDGSAGAPEDAAAPGGAADGGPSGGARDATVRTGAPIHADFLFVIDDSCGMAPKQARLRDGFSAFLDALQGRGDYQIGIVTTDTNSSGTEKGGDSVSTFSMIAPYDLTDLSLAACAPVPIDHGCLRGPDPGARIIRSSAFTRDQQLSAFRANASVGTCGSGIEQGLKAAVSALEQTGMGGCNEGLVRDATTDLVIIILSDENDADATPFATYLDRLAAIKPLNKIHVAMIVAEEGGAATSCSDTLGAQCGATTCANKPQDGSHTPCMADNQCPGPSSAEPEGESCQVNPTGGRWCENKALTLWDAELCGWCSFYDAPDCCDALAIANPPSDMPGVVPSPGRYLDFARALEDRAIAADPSIPRTSCAAGGTSAPVACLIETICQTDYAAALSEIAARF
jgi:hypothetical protein